MLAVMPVKSGLRSYGGLHIKTETFNRGNVRLWMNGQTEVFLLGKENDIVYVFVHFFNHFYKEGVGLRQISMLM